MQISPGDLGNVGRATLAEPGIADVFAAPQLIGSVEWIGKGSPLLNILPPPFDEMPLQSAADGGGSDRHSVTP